MAKGGFKVLVNGTVRRCHKIEADFDEGTIVIDRDSDMQKTPETQDFDRRSFAVMSVTVDDSPLQEQPKIPKSITDYIQCPNEDCCGCLVEGETLGDIKCNECGKSYEMKPKGT